MDERFTYLVQKYLDNNLEGEEVLEFEKYLQDPECADYLKKAEFLEREFKKIFGKEEGEVDMLEDTRGSGGQYAPGESYEIVRKLHRRMKIRRTILWIASGPAIAAAVLGFAYFLGTQHKPTPGDLYKCFYKPYANISIQGGAGEERVFTIKINKAYESKEYKISAQLCREVLAKDPSDRKTRFMYGLCLMELDSVQQAIGQFRLSEEDESNKGDLQWVYAKWYTVLSYLELGKKDDALKELEELRGSGSVYAGVVERERLFRDLERIGEEK